MKVKKQYWKGLDQLANTPEFQERARKEFPEYLPTNTGHNSDGEPSRRDFLKMMGFSLAAVSLAACEAPVRKAIPYIQKPVDVDPGIPNYYASTFISGSEAIPAVIKTREGRPIKVEPNMLSKYCGGSPVQMEASVLSLYDQQRLQDPMIAGKKVSWEELDAQVLGGLKGARRILVIGHSNASPSTQLAIDQLKVAYPQLKTVFYDTFSHHGLLEAYAQATGRRTFPMHDFSKAEVIVTVAGDFLSTFPRPDLVQKQFAATRKLNEDKQHMSRLYAFESNLSLTGANADYRTPILASEEGLYVANLYNLVARKAGVATVNVPAVGDQVNLEKAAKDLWASRGSSLVVAGSNDPAVQTLVIGINQLLNNYGKTIDLSKAILTRQGNDVAMSAAIRSLASGTSDAVIFYNCNPVYDHPLGKDLVTAIKKAKISISTTDRMDETAAAVTYIAPDHHYLESWNDFEIIEGEFSLSQPTIRNIFNTRQAQDSFLTWAGSEQSYFDLLQGNWKAGSYVSDDSLTFESFWDRCLQNGVVPRQMAPKATSTSITADVHRAASGVTSRLKTKKGSWELVCYQPYGVADGRQANNPWLQEMPDPITKATWDNYLTLSVKDAADLGISHNLETMTTQKVILTVGKNKVELPVLPQPGQKSGTVGLALGYGRTNAGPVADGVGINAYPLLSVDDNGQLERSVISGITLSSPKGDYKIAQTQTSQTVMDRGNVLQETVLKKYQNDPFAGAEGMKITSYDGEKEPYAVTLYKGHEYPNHHWGMSVDLNSCNGCNACVVACQTENNIPTVGKEEVLNRREMHWIRIDRYYSHTPEADEQSGIAKLRTMEKPAENPEVTFQPMMCQQCNSAPCETVCPVAATTHSTEGLNQMTYNRCIGTRYCANNCPYKVRRFNWFKYHDNQKFDKNISMNNDLGKMVLNPDVTVRARGVMEKCTFCVQRIQEGKLSAKKEGRRPIDGEIKPSCVTACSAGALVFGDMKNLESNISKTLKIKQEYKKVKALEPRAFHVLEELRVMPNVWYLRKVRNQDEVNEKAEA